MFITTHAALGAILGEQVPNHPYLAFALGMASHFLTDIIPHGDTNLYKEYIAGRKVKRSIAYVVIDAVAAIFLVLFFFNTIQITSKFAVTMGIIGGVLPDLIVAVYEVFRIRWLHWFHRVHFFFHNLISHEHDMSYAAGFGMQLVLLAGMIAFLT